MLSCHVIPLQSEVPVTKYCNHYGYNVMCRWCPSQNVGPTSLGGCVLQPQGGRPSATSVTSCGKSWERLGILREMRILRSDGEFIECYLRLFHWFGCDVCQFTERSRLRVDSVYSTCCCSGYGMHSSLVTGDSHDTAECE